MVDGPRRSLGGALGEIRKKLGERGHPGLEVSCGDLGADRWGRREDYTGVGIVGAGWRLN